MADRRDVIDAVRRANPVPDVTRVIPVPDEFDPLWQTIVTRSEMMDEQREGTKQALASRSEIERGVHPSRGSRGPHHPRRRQLLAGVGAAALAIAVLVGLVVVRSVSQPETSDPVGTDGEALDPEVVGEEPDPFALREADATGAIAAAHELVARFNAGRIDEALELVELDAVIFDSEPEDGEPAVGREALRRWVAFALALDGQLKLSDCKAQAATAGGSTARVICSAELSDLLAEHADAEPLSSSWRFYVEPSTGTMSRVEGLPPNLDHLRSLSVWANANESGRYEQDCAKVVWPNVRQIAEFDPEACAAFYREFAADWAANLDD